MKCKKPYFKDTIMYSNYPKMPILQGVKNMKKSMFNCIITIFYNLDNGFMTLFDIK